MSKNGTHKTLLSRFYYYSELKLGKTQKISRFLPHQVNRSGPSILLENSFDDDLVVITYISFTPNVQRKWFPIFTPYLLL